MYESYKRRKLQKNMECDIMISDLDIQKLIEDIKPIPYQVINGIKPKVREDKKHLVWSYELQSGSWNTFVVKIRQNTIYKFDFSVILSYKDDGNNLHIIKRYNGIHTHTNKIEKNKIRDFHIHTTTERYQEKGYEPEGYAEATEAYSDWRGALDTMIKECNFDIGNSNLDKFV